MDADATLYQIVQNSRVAMEVLRRHRLDFCCQGRQTLAVACREAGLDSIG